MTIWIAFTSVNPNLVSIYSLLCIFDNAEYLRQPCNDILAISQAKTVWCASKRWAFLHATNAYSILIWRKSLRRSTRRRRMWSGLAGLIWLQCRHPTATVPPFLIGLRLVLKTHILYFGVDCNIHCSAHTFVNGSGRTKFLGQNGDLEIFKKPQPPCILWRAKGYVL